MTIKIFSTDTECPNCGTDIYAYVHQKYFEIQNAFAGFEDNCPACGTALTVSVEPVPSFKIASAAELSLEPTQTHVPCLEGNHVD